MIMIGDDILSRQVDAAGSLARGVQSLACFEGTASRLVTEGTVECVVNQLQSGSIIVGKTDFENTTRGKLIPNELLSSILIRLSSHSKLAPTVAAKLAVPVEDLVKTIRDLGGAAQERCGFMDAMDQSPRHHLNLNAGSKLKYLSCWDQSI